MDALDFFTTLQTTPMLFAYGSGGGSWTSASGVGDSLVDFGKKNSKAVFNVLFGSYFGDWDCADNFLRAPLAGTPNSLGLCDSWGGIFLQHMALGEPIGFSTRFSQNYIQYGGWQAFGYSNHDSAINMNLMGDPTLRLHSVTPPFQVMANSAAGGITLGWTVSPDAAVGGYHVYRSTSANGPFTRITGTAATATSPMGAPLANTVTSYTDPGAGLASGTTYTYLVKSVKVETTPSGTYANQSVGEAVTLTHLAASPAPLDPTRLTVVRTGTATCVLTWDDNATNETGYLIERRDPATGVWSQIQAVAANTTTCTDLSSPVGQTVYYRVRASGTTNSGYSNEAADYGLPGLVVSDDDCYVVNKSTAGEVYIPASSLQNINLGLSNNAAGYGANGWNQAWFRMDGSVALPINNLAFGGQAPYTFDNLSNGALSASNTPAGAGNQDGWYLDNAITASICQVTDGTGVPAPGKVLATPTGANGRALRVFGDFFTGTETAAVMQIDFQLNYPASPIQYMLGGNGGTGAIDSNSQNRFGPKVSIGASSSGSATFNVYAKTTNGTFATGVAQTIAGLTNGHWYQVRLVMDFTANTGNGSGSLSYKDLTTGTLAPSATRISGTSGDIGVSYATSDFLSTAGVDYTTTGGTLAWAHGQSGSKFSSSIPLLDHSGSQLTKIVKLTYSAPTNGTALGTPSAAYCFIADPVAQVLPSPWATTTFGTMTSGRAGYAEQAGGVFGITGLSQTIRNGLAADAGRFLYLPVTGDCQLTARLSYMPATLSVNNVEAGMMIRGGLDSGAVTSMLIQQHWITPARASRSTAGAALSSASVGTLSYNNWGGITWMKLTRTGNTVSISQSPDGVTWTLSNADVALASLPSAAYVGLFISTETPGITPTGPLNYARFDNVTAYTVPAAVANLTAAAAGTQSGQVTLNWDATFGASAYLIERSASSGSGFVQISTTGTNAWTDSGLTAGQTYYYRVKATSPMGTSPAYSAEASAKPYLAASISGWRYENFGAETNAGSAADMATPANDGIVNLLKYTTGFAALTLNPRVGGTVSAEWVGGTQYLTFTLTRRATATDVTLSVEAANRLAGPWASIDPLLPGNQVRLQANTPAAGIQTITVKDTQPKSASPVRFMRIRASRP